jgi:7-keto-8-aminopelargonate synthetase-like enzyme
MAIPPLKTSSVERTLETLEQERQERLSQNARKIREDAVNTLLLDMTDDEREVVFAIVGRERPDALGSADVISATLLRVRTVGVENLRTVMEGTTRQEQLAVWDILKSASAEERTGMDGGAACREALRQVRSDEYLGG